VVLYRALGVGAVNIPPDEEPANWGMLACVFGIVIVLALLATWACLELR